MIETFCDRTVLTTFLMMIQSIILNVISKWLLLCPVPYLTVLRSREHNASPHPHLKELFGSVLCFFFQSEDIRLEPELHSACGKDIERFCSAVSFGNAQVSWEYCKQTWNKYIHSFIHPSLVSMPFILELRYYTLRRVGRLCSGPAGCSMARVNVQTWSHPIGGNAGLLNLQNPSPVSA